MENMTARPIPDVFCEHVYPVCRVHWGFLRPGRSMGSQPSWGWSQQWSYNENWGWEASKQSARDYMSLEGWIESMVRGYGQLNYTSMTWNGENNRLDSHGNRRREGLPGGCPEQRTWRSVNVEKIGYTCVLQPKLNCRMPVTGSKQRAGLGIWSPEEDGNVATDKAIKRMMQGPEELGARRGQKGNPADMVTLDVYLINPLFMWIHTLYTYIITCVYACRLEIHAIHSSYTLTSIFLGQGLLHRGLPSRWWVPLFLGGAGDRWLNPFKLWYSNSLAIGNWKCLPLLFKALL